MVYCRLDNKSQLSESLFKTLKYCPQFPNTNFSSINEARSWVKNFVHWYNCEHLHSGIKFVTPSQKHLGLDVEILKNRKLVYELARKKNPNRWTRQIRNWNAVDEVYLNPLQNKNEVAMSCAS